MSELTHEEKTLATLLKELLLEKDVVKINHYFGANFWDEYPDEDEDVLDYLASKFFDIDMMWCDDKNIEKPTRETLKHAIEMLEDVK